VFSTTKGVLERKVFEDKEDILFQNQWKVFRSDPGSVLAAVNSGITKQEALG